ncbi:hypothetical protein [Synechococcus sp. A15-44]|uniref:hypothetical protein n=1 Tax=Synechococcus sp. A15-44 TaxID=1050646 RepID=UPI00164720CE|nr:hypothetical protein [Synechococcus sp. A15-44]
MKNEASTAKIKLRRDGPCPLYTEIFLPGPAGINRNAKEKAQRYLEEKDWADLEASPGLDERLLSAAKASSEQLPLPCLR